MSTIRKTADGHFLMRHNIQGTFSQVFSLFLFPFDSQTLTITVSLDIAYQFYHFDSNSDNLRCTADGGHNVVLKGSEV